MDVHMQTHRQIVRFLDNFKKLGRPKHTPAVVRSRILSLDKLWTRFNDDHAGLERTVTEASKASISYFTDHTYDETEDAYHHAMDYLAEVMEELDPPLRHDRSVDSSFNRVGPSAFTSAHLPVIQVPPFDGVATEWEAFRNRFTAVIIENRELHDFARMHYLISFLRGRALECLSGLAISAENFPCAWQVLKDRYDSKRRLVSAHMSVLLSLPQLSRESAVEIQDLRSKVQLALASLANLSRSAEDLWNDILVHIILGRLDATTRRAWTMRAQNDSEPFRFDALDRFMVERVRALEDAARESPHATVKRASGSPRIHTTLALPRPSACPVCQANHYFSSCPRFVNGSASERRELVKRHKRCFNCLSPKHAVGACSSKFSCRKCQRRHHSLLHDSSPVETPSSSKDRSAAVSLDPDDLPAASHSMSAASPAGARPRVILATALVRVRASCGRVEVVRALLDQGSEVTLVSERLSQTLRAKHWRVTTSICAVGGVSAGRVSKAVELFVTPVSSSSPSVAVTALVLPTLTSYAPRGVWERDGATHLAGLTLADPNPFSQAPVEILLGADIYGDLICEGIRRGPAGQPTAQRTIFGWVVSGPIGEARPGDSPAFPSHSARSANATHSSVHCLASLETELKRFWEVEEVPSLSPISPHDEQCEMHFARTHSRTPEGRYRVRLPFKEAPPLDVGSSRSMAERSLSALLRRLNRDPDRLKAYAAFMGEYEALGHMRRVPTSHDSLSQLVYIPHHPVFRTRQSGAGLRVVFNASSVTSNGTTLNDHMLAGPKLQTDLSAVIMRWRQFKLVFSADIAKMFRQILLDDADLDYQRILWTDELHEPPCEYQLMTVTYGMACAPFLALRVLKQLREDEGHAFPLASAVLENNIYVDDVLFGGDTEAHAIRVRNELDALLARGGFPLRKWSSNSLDLLADIPADHRVSTDSRDVANLDQVKVLGINWRPHEDAFCFAVSLPDIMPLSKRAILSTIAKLFDPLGWVTPVTITTKIFLQSLWRHTLAWDDPVPPDLLRTWQRMYRALPKLSGLRVPRWTGLRASNQLIELHGFADASTVAYAAVVYCKVISSANEVTISLLAGKSRVAPIEPLSVARLELLAAVLLARLLNFTRQSLSLHAASCFCWSDSRVVLSWLARHPSTWKVFVAHRVQSIHALLPDVQWRYVPTDDNPADCASRGLLGDELESHPLWWNGPPWLAQGESEWPVMQRPLSEDAPLERRVAALHVRQTHAPEEFLARFSSWPRLLRVLSYIRRFIAACRRDPARYSGSHHAPLALGASELSSARIHAVKMLQSLLFAEEIRILAQGRSLSSRNPLLPLSPVLDEDGLLRVGGRLNRAPLPLAVRRPMLLSAHRVTDLIVDHAHLRALHGGLQSTLSVLRREYWVIRSRGIARRRIHQCLVCVRERAAIPTQFMGDLPAHRVSAPPRPFTHVGVDYAGPVCVRCSPGRGSKSRKGYIAVFICLATRAIHLELVSDYSTPAFLGAFARFVSRRGLPSTVYSDNGTTFVGADRELTAAYNATIRDSKVQSSFASERIEWKFIPPSAPHFGGLWEAGVKSVKHHLRRVLKTYTLTFEEYATLLCRIEACLNSRPLAPLSDSFENYEPLTPGHFLIGSALTSYPEQSLLDVCENRLKRWQMVSQMNERFWRLWYDDYVNLLQQRYKWRCPKDPLRVGQLVLLRDHQSPPCKWRLGRVIHCYPGSDGLVRVVSVRTASSDLIRPISKLCVLPVDCNDGQHGDSVPEMH